jgi:hypothetical protein
MIGSDEDAGVLKRVPILAEKGTQADADKSIEFATALGQFLYVLPAMVTRGRTPPVN